MDTASPNRLKRIAHVDLDTGEVMEHATMALVLRRARNGFGKRWFAMAQDPLGDLARKGDKIGLQAMRVLLLMLDAMDYENSIALSNGQAARELEMSPSNISRATKKLVEMGVIEEGPKLGSMKSFRLHPGFGWKGSGRNHVKALNGG